MTRVDIWKKTLLSPLGSIGDAIKILNDTALRIVLIADSDLKLVGTVTDGDIRRGLLRDLTLASPISEVTNTKPIVVPQKFAREVVLEIMSSHKVFQIPVVDEGLKLVGLHVRNEQNTHAARDNVVVIMAGGKGTRLLPKTEKIPKPMALISGRPILAHIIEKACSEGFTQIYLSLGYLGHIIQDYFGDGTNFGVSINYLKENTPLGTAGALYQMRGKFKAPVLVTNGDIITEVSFSDLYDHHLLNRSAITVAVRSHEITNPFGVVSIEGDQIVNLVEKPVYKSYVSAGLYVLNPRTVNFVDDGSPVDMPDLVLSVLKSGLKVNAYFVHEDWADIGTTADLKEIRSKRISVTSHPYG
jgi:dTDP-glucose pyrophosphorylase